MKKPVEKISSKWRVDNGYVGRGVVVLFDGEIQGWINELRDPHHWRPGCIAIDEFNNKFVSAGGNYYDGAISWNLL